MGRYRRSRGGGGSCFNFHYSISNVSDEVIMKHIRYSAGQSGNQLSRPHKGERTIASDTAGEDLHVLINQLINEGHHF